MLDYLNIASEAVNGQTLRQQIVYIQQVLSTLSLTSAVPKNKNIKNSSPTDRGWSFFYAEKLFFNVGVKGKMPSEYRERVNASSTSKTGRLIEEMRQSHQQSW